MGTSAFFVITRSFGLNSQKVLNGNWIYRTARPFCPEISGHVTAESAEWVAPPIGTRVDPNLSFCSKKGMAYGHELAFANMGTSSL